MTPAGQAAEDARLALTTALSQLAEAVSGPYARLDEDTRASYGELHRLTAGIVRRLGFEVGRQTRDLEAQLQVITDSISLHEQQRIDDLAAPLQDIQQRLGGDLLKGIRHPHPPPRHRPPPGRLRPVRRGPTHYPVPA